MKLRDSGDAWWIDLQRVKARLDDLENCEDSDEMIAIAQELSADIDSIMYDINQTLDLRMGEEE